MLGYDQVDLPDTDITDNQLAWLFYKITKWISEGGGTFRSFVEELGSDYSTVYNAGGMEFTNTIFDLQNPEIGRRRLAAEENCR